MLVGDDLKQKIDRTVLFLYLMMRLERFEILMWKPLLIFKYKVE